MSNGDPKHDDISRDRVGHEGKHLTTDQGVRIEHTDDSLTAGDRGPTLIEDFHFREKRTRFDHERIPERTVHARGAGAYGTFTCTDSLADVTRAAFLAEEGLQTPVFVRFSTVAGSRGSADTVRDVRGFATKFYTREGNFDLVGNNMPVFFIQDGIKFPDFVHAVKPEPDNEIPQAPPPTTRCGTSSRSSPRRCTHDHVADVGPGAAAQLPDDAGLRRPHVPVGRRRRQRHVRQVPLASQARHALVGLG
jgi:catalase